VKGWLFFVLGMLAGMLLFLQHPTPKCGVLLVVTVWAFCRFYYFAFYVTQKLRGPELSFNGLFSAARYWLWDPKKTLTRCLSSQKRQIAFRPHQPDA